MNGIDLFNLSFWDVIDIILVGLFLYYVYKLLKGTTAINILIGILFLFAIYKVTSTLQLRMFSSILGALLGVGAVGLMIVFQQEIRKFLLMMGSANFKTKRNIFKQFNFLKTEIHTETDVDGVVETCYKLAHDRNGALIVFERTNNLDFVTRSGDRMYAEVSPALIESIFFPNSPLHDGAVIIKNNMIKACRVVLPISSNPSIPKRFGLRHKAAIGITEKTDAVCIVVSEETGEVSFVVEGELQIVSEPNDLKNKLKSNM